MHSLWKSRRRASACLLLESLEARTLLSATYYVSPTGNDNNSGTLAQPYATIQAVVWKLQPGDTLDVLPGTYAGFVVGFDDPGQSPYGEIDGTAAAPITIQAAPGSAAGSVIINSRNAKTTDGIDLENSSYLIIQGFDVNNASGTIARAGIRSVANTNVTIRNNIADKNGEWGIFTGFSENVTIDGNTASNSVSQHGIYVSNSADNPVVTNNICFGNYDCGIQLNSDASEGGDGIISNALISGNIIHDNGASGGSAINLDGVQNSRIQNNLLYNNHASGISLFMIDGAEGAKDNVIINNTIIMPTGSRWAVNIVDGSTGNVVYNNILLNLGSHGAINIDAESLPGFVSDYNAVVNLMSPDDGDTFDTLAAWRTATGQDLHSFVATAAQLFVNSGANDYHLSATSPAIDAGTNLAAAPAPTTDIDGLPRPIGSNWDSGAYERDTILPTAALASVPLGTAGSLTYTFSVRFTDNVAIRASSLDSSDILVTGPGGYSQLARLVSIDNAADGSPRVAQYKITTASTWAAGNYTAQLQPGQVSDTTGNFAATATLGTLKPGFISIVIAGLSPALPLPPPSSLPPLNQTVIPQTTKIAKLRIILTALPRFTRWPVAKPRWH